MLTKFEDLPNEILIDFFQYFDARELFRIFYNLNSRLNVLITSFHHLNLIYFMKFFTDNQIDDDQQFPIYVDKLLVGRAININLNQFSNISYLKLECPLKRVLAQLNSNILPNLKHLSIIHFDILTTIDEWTSLPSLHSLKVSCITSLVYKTILKVCPNLMDLQISIFSSDELKSNIDVHKNLKRLVIDIADVIWPWNDQFFDNYLSCVPNLERFHVYRSIFISKLTQFALDYDWLASKIQLYLLLLRRFKFFFKIIQSDNTSIELNNEEILCQIQQIFVNNHNNQYKAQFIIYE